VQVEPQLIPEGLLVTVPDPVPDFETVNLYTTDVVKVVVTGVAAGLVTVKVPVPAYPPFDLLKDVAKVAVTGVAAGLATVKVPVPACPTID
jgi:hypothetical protein